MNNINNRIVYNDNSDDIFKLIKHIMLDKNIKQVDIANNVGQTKQTISNLLNCKSKNVNLNTLKMLCDAIDCDLIISIVDKDSNSIDNDNKHSGSKDVIND